MPPEPLALRIIALFKALVFGGLAILLALLLFWLAENQRAAAYQAGMSAGRRIGQREAFRLSRAFSTADMRTVDVIVTPVADSSEKEARSAPIRQTRDVCLTPSVLVPELLVRSSPSLTATVITSLSRGTAVGVICRSEQLLQSVAWVQIVMEQPQTPALVGWVPGQDIAYPPICARGHVKPARVVLRQSDSVFADPVSTITHGMDVGVICNSAGGVWGEDVWVRIQVIIDNTIVLGWVPANDVLE